MQTLLDIIVKFRNRDTQSGTYSTLPQQYTETKISFQAIGKATDDNINLAWELLYPLYNTLYKDCTREQANSAWRVENSVSPKILLASLIVPNLLIAQKLVELVRKSAEFSITIIKLPNSVSHEVCLAFSESMLNTSLGRELLTNNIAMICSEYETSKLISEKSTIMKQNIFKGTQIAHTQEAIKTLSNEGIKFSSNKDFQLAIDKFSHCIKLLELNQRFFSDNLVEYNKLYGYVYYNLANTYCSQGDMQQAKDYFMKAYDSYNLAGQSFLAEQMQNKLKPIQAQLNTVTSMAEKK